MILRNYYLFKVWLHHSESLQKNIKLSKEKFSLITQATEFPSKFSQDVQYIR